jgi:hypothetical protein
MSQVPTPPIPFLFPESFTQMDAEPWAKIMADVDQDCHVERVEYFKGRDNKEHEFLVVEILHDNTGSVARVLVDRAPEESSNKQGVISSRPSQLSSSSVRAHDQVRVEGSKDSKAKFNKTITDGFEPFDLLTTLTYG